MDFVPIDPSVPVEMDPLKVLLNFAGFTDTQVTKIKQDGFDSIDDMTIQALEKRISRSCQKPLVRCLPQTALALV
jgi:hypothetical protein